MPEETYRVVTASGSVPAPAVRSFVPWASPAMRAVDWLAAEIASTAIPVLLVGERGTGKDVVAAQIHARSPRQSGRLVKLDCAALTPDALDRLFAGHGNGNGAAEERTTVLLDEVSELHPACQAGLLEALSFADGRSGRPAGRVGVISATRHNLEEAVRGGRFLDALYYRIGGITLRLPPLRHRREDIAPLADFFLAEYAAVLAQPRPSLSARGLETLMNYGWPDNIWELERVMKRLAALGDESLALAALRWPHQAAPPGDNGGSVRPLKEAARAASRQAERRLILQVLEQTRWNRKRAARQLQISYKALLYKLKQIGLDDEPGEPGPPPKAS